MFLEKSKTDNLPFETDSNRKAGAAFPMLPGNRKSLWHNPRVDGGAQNVAREISDVFLRGIYAMGTAAH